MQQEIKYAPIGCEHKWPNGFSSWMFQSEECGSSPDFNHNVGIVVCKQCGTIRISGFRQGKDGNINRFSEEISIHSADAIDAMIKYANFIHEEVVWGRKQHPAGGNGWVKGELPSKAGDYYCNCKIDGSLKKLIVEFDKNGRWGEAPGHDYYESFEIIEWLDESPNEQPVVNNAFNKDNARYELSLALRSLLKILKFAIGDDMTRHQKGQYDAAEAMLIKHSHITDVLRTESNEQPVENAKWVKCGVATDPSKSGLYKVRSGVKDGEAEYNNFFGEWNAKWDEWLDEQPVEQKEKEAVDALAFYKWMMQSGWREHSSGNYYYRSKDHHQWPLDETCEESELYNEYQKQKNGK